MLEGYFSQTLVYICDHDKRGALGLIVNRKLDMEIGEVLQEMQIPVTKTYHSAVYDGGPVDPSHGLILYPCAQKSAWPDTYQFSHNVCISSSREILQAIGKDNGPKKFLLLLGHSGWGPGQLEEELAQNTWLSVPADLDILFSVPVESKLQRAADKLGIDLGNISTETGHA